MDSLKRTVGFAVFLLSLGSAFAQAHLFTLSSGPKTMEFGEVLESTPIGLRIIPPNPDV